MQVILSGQALEFISLSKNSRNEKKNKCIKESKEVNLVLGIDVQFNQVVEFLDLVVVGRAFG